MSVAIAAAGAPDAIRMDNITVRFNTHQALSQVAWRVPQGEHWAVLGPNGSGKTTLLNVINGFVWPYGGEGTVEVLGQRLGDCNIFELRRSIGWMGASLHDRLFRDQPCWEIVVSAAFAAFGLWGHRDEVTAELRDRALGILEQLGCGDLAHRVYGTLSRGEQQQVLLCRVLMNDPKLLLLDEPCAGLDFVGREKLLNTVSRLVQQPDPPTVIYVTHHAEEILPAFDRVLLLAEGRVAAQGPKTEVLDPGVLQEAYRVKLEVQWHRGRPLIWVADPV